jgi:hypothetical protein
LRLRRELYERIVGWKGITGVVEEYWDIYEVIPLNGTIGSPEYILCIPIKNGRETALPHPYDLS